MIATFFKVHHHVEKGDLVSTSACVQSFKITCKNELVVFSERNKTDFVRSDSFGCD